MCPKSIDSWAFFFFDGSAAIWISNLTTGPREILTQNTAMSNTMVKKIKNFGLGIVFCFAPDVVILEIGTDDLCNI